MHMLVLEVFQKNKQVHIHKIYLIAFMKVEMLEKMNRWFYATQNWNGQHCVFVIHSRLFRNLILLQKKKKRKPKHCDPETFKKEFRCKIVSKNAERLGIRTSVIIITGQS